MSEYAYKNRAVFIDVDGVIRHNNTSKKDGCYYVTNYKDVDYRTEMFDGLRILELAGYKLFFVSMQNCIVGSLGTITYNDISKIFDRMIWDLYQLGIHITDYKICQSEDESSDSKIESKFNAINDLAVQYHLNIDKSIGIGDRINDLLSYKMAGIENRIHIINGYEFNDVINRLFGITECDIISHFLGSETITKVWGNEYIIVNDVHGYCCKLLEVQPNYQCSLHHHKNKHETFVVLAGVLCLEYCGEIGFYYVGDSIEIMREEDHRFWTPIDHPCWFMEVSNYSDDKDCYRMEESCRCVEVEVSTTEI
jgi:histidinol phosphatase-like enzyme/mannose-6-phosphate isomerase-like protein (cupin superfamily)